MKGRENKVGAAPSTDLLVCFPSRAHLALMPKSICSPSRPNEPPNRHRHHRPHHHLNKATTRIGSGVRVPPSQASPVLWVKPSKQMGCGGVSRPDQISEPTSPKVTCAGQIKVKPSSRASACRNWQSVMEEIERIHNNKKHKKSPSWVESFGFKKDIMQFLTCLRSIRFNFRCFGSFPAGQDITSDDEAEEEEEVDENHAFSNYYRGTQLVGGDEEESSRTVFSKWFMVLQENLQADKEEKEKQRKGIDDFSGKEPAAPPPNALLLMRCRSAPAQSRLQVKVEDQDEDDVEEGEKEEKTKAAGSVTKKRETLAMVMQYDTDFHKLSSDIAKETWVDGGLMDPLSRSRSWKR